MQLGFYNGGGGNVGHSIPSTNVHSGSHPGTGYTTPNDVSGLLTPDLDLPIDFEAFDDFPVTDSLRLHGFTSHPPSVPTPHTHHYPPQQTHQQQHQPVHPGPSHGHGEHCVTGVFSVVYDCFCRLSVPTPEL